MDTYRVLKHLKNIEDYFDLNGQDIWRDAVTDICADWERRGEENAQLESEVKRVKLLLGKAAQEINCAGPVDHRIRVLRREHADLVERLTRERDEARADWERRGEALREMRHLESVERHIVSEHGCDQAPAITQLRELARAALEGGKP